MRQDQKEKVRSERVRARQEENARAEGKDRTEKE